MKRILWTDPDNWASLIGRITLSIVVFPHGAQKLFGWFEGNGFEGTMIFFTRHMQLPWIIGFLVILIETFAPVLLIIGLITRIAAFLIFVNFVGIILTTNLKNGFFMNWSMMPDTPEGYEYHLLILGVCIMLIISGGGKASMDAMITRDSMENKYRKGRLST
jgi:putative oxidoreductase